MALSCVSPCENGSLLDGVAATFQASAARFCVSRLPGGLNLLLLRRPLLLLRGVLSTALTAPGNCTGGSSRACVTHDAAYHCAARRASRARTGCRARCRCRRTRRGRRRRLRRIEPALLHSPGAAFGLVLLLLGVRLTFCGVCELL